MSLIRILFAFDGRISRTPFWLFTFATGVIVFVPVVFFLGFGSDAAEDYTDLCCLLLLWPSLAVQAKRWHDRDMSAWWILINFVPFGIVFSLVQNGFMEGTPGANRFGANPLLASPANVA